MSRYRKVDPRMWGDAKFRRLSHNAQRVWLYLLTGPETTSLPGVLVTGRAALAEAIGLDAEAFAEAFAEVLREGMAKADFEARFVWLPNACRYNTPESPNVVKSWRHHWDDAPECELKNEAFRGLKAFAEGLGKAFAEAFAKACPHPFANQEQEQEQECERAPARTHAHTREARDSNPSHGSDGPPTELSPEAEQILVELRRHKPLASLATERVADGIAGRMFTRGTKPDWVLAAIADAARELGAEDDAGHPRPEAQRATLLARYCDRARAPRDEPAPSLPAACRPTTVNVAPTAPPWCERQASRPKAVAS